MVEDFELYAAGTNGKHIFIFLCKLNHLGY